MIFLVKMVNANSCDKSFYKDFHLKYIKHENRTESEIEFLERSLDSVIKQENFDR